MPRFVLLRHECPSTLGQPSHWDLMLERDGVLMTWRLLGLPRAWQSSTGGAAPLPSPPIDATRLPDHRLAYLDYEGPVSHDRGEVRRHDAGVYEVLAQSEGLYRVDVRGSLIGATLTLRQLDGHAWRLELEAPNDRGVTAG